MQANSSEYWLTDTDITGIMKSFSHALLVYGNPLPVVSTCDHIPQSMAPQDSALFPSFQVKVTVGCASITYSF